MIKFRRGLEDGAWQKAWHFNERCTDYPARNFVIADYPPPREDECAQCRSLAQDKSGTI